MKGNGGFADHGEMAVAASAARRLCSAGTRGVPQQKEGRMTYDIMNWMSRVTDATKLSGLSIPGTHDSAAMKRPGFDNDRLTTQTRTITQQLEAGVRFLDLRIGYTRKGFGLYHEDTSLNITFDAVLEMCGQFLKDHPRETIIASIKDEYIEKGADSTVSFTFYLYKRYIEPARHVRWYVENRIPVMIEVRGKVVLFRRFKLNTGFEVKFGGINAFDGFPSNTTGEIPGPRG